MFAGENDHVGTQRGETVTGTSLDVPRPDVGSHVVSDGSVGGWQVEGSACGSERGWGWGVGWRSGGSRGPEEVERWGG